MYYEEASEVGKKGVDYDQLGRVDLTRIKDEALLPKVPDADY